MKPNLTKPMEITAEALPHDPVVTTTSIHEDRFEAAENRMRKCPRCGRPIVIPRATFCCIRCAIEDKEENDERVKTIAEYEAEDIE